MMRSKRHEDGQASLEYLLIGLVLLSLMGALSALWHFASSGRLTQLIESGSSHALSSIGGVFDALLF